MMNVNVVKMNSEKFQESFEKYLEKMKNTDWLSRYEAYKFKFARWVHERADLNQQTDAEIRNICIRSQEEDYGGPGRGVNFLRLSIRFGKEVIGTEDIAVIRKLAGGAEPTEKLLKGIMSLTQFSAWAATLLPEKFYPFPSIELVDSLEYLYETEDLPRKGFKAFVRNQKLMKELDNRIIQEKETLSTVFRDKLGFNAFLPVDRVWLVQDFLLFIQREILPGKFRFTWIPFFKELSEKLADYRDKQFVLVNILKKSGITEGFGDRGPGGNPMELDEIDPFTFIAFITKFGQKKLPGITKKIKSLMNLQSEVPADFSGIPQTYAGNVWFFPFKKDRFDNAIPLLWDFHEACLKNKVPEELFRNVIRLHMVGLSKLTDKLFLMMPERYLPLDKQTRPFLESVGLTLEVDSFEDYLKLTEDAREATGLTPYEISYKAWLENYYTRFAGKEIEPGVEEPAVRSRRYWIYAPGRQARFWNLYYQEGLMGIGWNEIGNFANYHSREEMKKSMQEKIDPEGSFSNDSKACWEFLRVMSPGDIVIAKQGRKKYLGYGVVTSDAFYDPQRSDYHNLRKVDWKKKGEWVETDGNIVLKTLTDVTGFPDYVNRLRTLLGIKEANVPEPGKGESHERYTLENALEDVFLEREEMIRIIELLRYKKNILLQGPPGTGKTYLARRLAYAMMGVKDGNRVEMVQFHQSYSYEDFIQGYRPAKEGGFYLKNGVFYDFCRKAREDPDHDYFFIIDEINRGNLSKIFGELMMLIEHDKRGEDFAIQLTYTDDNRQRFYIPENLYMIGTMNTADRSLAIVDYALRRRFAFVDIMPRFNGKFRDYLKKNSVSPELIEQITERMEALNQQITGDDHLRKYFTIGHSYFCSVPEKPDQEWYKRIIRYEVGPLLKEYWFDNESVAESHIEKLLS